MPLCYSAIRKRTPSKTFRSSSLPNPSILRPILRRRPAMDYSSAEAQQQQSDQQQTYDPAQAQAYAAYYAACDQYYAASAYYNQPYYPHDYSSSSTAASSGVYYAEAQPDSAAPQADAAQIHHSGSHGTAYAPATEQDGYPYQAAAGLNSAAVAALSQLSQLTGSIDAAERMMAAGMHNRPQSSHYQQYSNATTTQHGVPSISPGGGGATHRGGGRRGGGPLRGRGGNRGRLGQPPSGRDGGGPTPSRGRGHGRMSRGRGRRPPHFALDSQLRQNTIATPLEPSISAAANAQGGPFFTPKAPPKSLLPVAWCDICRVDCNSLEILEQHKNGKRHKRTVMRVQEIQSHQKEISAEFQGEDGRNILTNVVLDSTYTTNRAIPSSAGGTEASSVQVPVVEESIQGFVVSENNQQDMEVVNQAQIPEGQSEPVSDETLPIDGLDRKRRMVGYDRNDRWRGSKHKMMRIGRGGKHFRSFDRTHNRAFERPKDRPRDQPRVCTVCNVMCDTMAVFECHLAGKKHISRIKRFDGHGSVYGPISVYIPPNQPTPYPSKGPEPLFYGLQSLETLQQEAALRHEMLQQGSLAVNTQQVEAALSEVKESLGGPTTDASVAATTDPNIRSSLIDPDAGTTNNSASDDRDVMEGAALPIVGDVAQYGASIKGEDLAPVLDVNSEEPLSDSE